MKIALCLHGQPRNWRPASLYLKGNVIIPYDTDIFGHTWWDESQIGKEYGTSPWMGDRKYFITSGDIEGLKKTYQFKEFKTDPPRNFLDEKKYKVLAPEKHDSIIDSFKSRCFSLKSVLTMTEEYEKQNNLNYDWLIISRYDVEILRMPMLLALHPNKIYVENYVHRGRKWILNDMFIILGRKYKYIHKNLYDDFDKNWELIQNIPDKYLSIIKGTELEHTTWVNPEEFLAFNLLFNDALENACKIDELRVNALR